jgi:hypothetical protein
MLTTFSRRILQAGLISSFAAANVCYVNKNNNAGLLSNGVNICKAPNFFSVMASGNPSNPSKASTIYEFSAVDIDGNDVSLEKYRGHVCIIVNVASK